MMYHKFAKKKKNIDNTKKVRQYYRASVTIERRDGVNGTTRTTQTVQYN